MFGGMVSLSDVQYVSTDAHCNLMTDTKLESLRRTRKAMTPIKVFHDSPFILRLL